MDAMTDTQKAAAQKAAAQKKEVAAPAWVRPSKREKWLAEHPWHGENPEWDIDPDMVVHVATAIARANLGERSGDPSGFMSEAKNFLAAMEAVKTFKPVDRSKPTPAEVKAKADADAAAKAKADADAKAKADAAAHTPAPAPVPASMA